MGVDSSDDSLLAGMAMGDADAAATFVRRYQPRVFGLAFTIVRSFAVAEEVAQEAFLRIWRNAAAYERESSSMHVEDREQLRSALRALPPEQGRLIVLSVFYGLTAKETADVEGIPLGTAKTRIRRGIAKLRAALGVSGG